MKTIITSLLVTFSLTAITLSAALAEATPNRRAAAVATYTCGMYTTAAGKLSIALDKQTGGTVVVRLVNSTGKELFVEHIGKNRKVARLLLDVSALPDGDYRVEITNGVDKTLRALTFVTQQPSVSGRLIAIN